MWESTSGTNLCGINRKILRKSYNLEIMSYGFPKEKEHVWENSRKDGLVHFECNIFYPIIFLFLFLFVENNKIRGEIAHSIAHSKTRDHTSM
jgi:hypothetical protein